MDDRGERAVLPTTYAPMGKWKERLFRGIKAIVLRDAKDRVGLLLAFGPARPAHPRRSDASRRRALDGD
jgi:hypothetical protein